MSVVRSCRSLFMRQIYRWERILIDQMCMESVGPKSRFYTYKFENSYCCIVDPQCQIPTKRDREDEIREAKVLKNRSARLILKRKESERLPASRTFINRTVRQNALKRSLYNAPPPPNVDYSKFEIPHRYYELMVSELKNVDSVYPSICDLIQLSTQKRLRNEISNSPLLQLIVKLFYESTEERMKAGYVYILINLCFDEKSIDVLCLNGVVEVLSIYAGIINSNEIIPLSSEEVWNHPESDYALQLSCTIALSSLAEHCVKKPYILKQFILQGGLDSLLITGHILPVQPKGFNRFTIFEIVDTNSSYPQAFRGLVGDILTPRYVTHLISIGTLSYFEKNDFERVERRIHVTLGTLSTVEREDWRIKHLYKDDDIEAQNQLLECIKREYKHRISLSYKEKKLTKDMKRTDKLRFNSTNDLSERLQAASEAAKLEFEYEEIKEEIDKEKEEFEQVRTMKRPKTCPIYRGFPLITTKKQNNEKKWTFLSFHWDRVSQWKERVFHRAASKIQATYKMFVCRRVYVLKRNQREIERIKFLEEERKKSEYKKKKELLEKERRRRQALKEKEDNYRALLDKKRQYEEAEILRKRKEKDEAMRKKREEKEKALREAQKKEEEKLAQIKKEEEERLKLEEEEKKRKDKLELKRILQDRYMKDIKALMKDKEENDRKAAESLQRKKFDPERRIRLEMVLLQQKRCKERALITGADNLPPPPPKNTSPNRYSNVSRVSRVSRITHPRRTSELLEQIASRPTETSFYDPSSGYYFDYTNNNYYDPKTFENVGTVDDYGYPPKESFIKAKVDYDTCYGDNQSEYQSSRISNTSSVSPYKYSDNWNQYYADQNQWYNYDNKKGNYGEYGYGQEKYNKQDFKKDYQNYYGGDNSRNRDKNYSKYYDEKGKSYYQNIKTGTATYAIPEEQSSQHSSASPAHSQILNKISA